MQKIDCMVDVREAAKFLGLSSGHVNHLRYLGKGPKWVRVGSRSVRYLSGDLEEYKAEREKITEHDGGAK
jgi:predicted DNA-binding transcriptional regulator AlpA